MNKKLFLALVCVIAASFSAFSMIGCGGPSAAAENKSAADPKKDPATNHDAKLFLPDKSDK